MQFSEGVNVECELTGNFTDHKQRIKMPSIC